MSAITVDEGSQHDRNSIYLATKRGRWIRNVRRQERAPDSMRAAERNCLSRFQDLKTRSLSATYNCFGMVFASRRTCILEGEVDKILVDDGYRRIAERSAIEVGDIVIYRKVPNQEITHAGVIITVHHLPATAEIKLTLMSQWGADGEYIHLENEVPNEYGQYREYYTERRLP